MNIDTLEQDPCNTCGYEEGSIYCKEHCPHEAKIDQEPCEMTAEEYRQRMIQAFHNADTDELIAICVLPTEKEFKHLEWLLKNHYKHEPCDNAVSKQAVLDIVDSYSESRSNVEDVTQDMISDIMVLPPVTPQLKTGHWIDIMVGDMPAQACDQCNTFYPLAYTGGGHKYCPNCGAKMVEPQERRNKE